LARRLLSDHLRAADARVRVDPAALASLGHGGGVPGAAPGQGALGPAARGAERHRDGPRIRGVGAEHRGRRRDHSPGPAVPRPTGPLPREYPRAEYKAQGAGGGAPSTKRGDQGADRGTDPTEQRDRDSGGGNGTAEPGAAGGERAAGDARGGADRKSVV